MPTRQWNRDYWNPEGGWTDKGENFADIWGTSEAQWYGTIYPRIHRFVPAETILEIACGYGRGAVFLQNYCERYIGIDLVQQCVDACRERFGPTDRLQFYQNDGLDLSFIPNESVDFVYSWDSLVHAEPAVIRNYLAQLPRILKATGAAFLHHGNLGAYPFQSWILYKRYIRRAFSLLGLTERGAQNRDPRTTAATVAQEARSCGLVVIQQELVNWKTHTALFDCFTTLRRSGNKGRLITNRDFMREAATWKRCHCS